MTSRKSLAQNRLPKDRVLYCDRCGISFLWSGEEQQMDSRPTGLNSVELNSGAELEADNEPESGDKVDANLPHIPADEPTKTVTPKTPTHCAGCRTLMAAEGRERGVVKWYNPRKRFGFITRTDGTEIFAHGSRLRNAKRLRDGAFVEFRATQGKQGPAATEIQVLEERPSTTE